MEGAVVRIVATVVAGIGFSVGSLTISTYSSKISNPLNKSGSMSSISTAPPLPSSVFVTDFSLLPSSMTGMKKSSMTSVPGSWFSSLSVFLLSLGHIGGIPCSRGFLFSLSLGHIGIGSSDFTVVVSVVDDEVVVGSIVVRYSVVVVISAVVY